MLNIVLTLQPLSPAAVVDRPYVASISSVWVLLLLGLLEGQAEAFLFPISTSYISSGHCSTGQVALVLSCLLFPPPQSNYPTPLFLLTDRCSRGCSRNTFVINSFIQSVILLFNYLQNTFTPKP